LPSLAGCAAVGELLKRIPHRDAVLSGNLSDQVITL
jgi:hypothetical protein